MTPIATTEYRVPGFFVPHIEVLVAERGGDIELLYAQSSIDRNSFSPLVDTLTESQLYAMIRSASILIDEPAFGLEMGRCFNVGSFGVLSRALMNCATLRDVAQMLERYSVLVLPLIRFSSYERNSEFIIEVATLARYSNLNQILFEALIACAAKMLPVLVGCDVTADKIFCQFEAPSYMSRFNATLAREFEFGADNNLVVFQIRHADLELVTSNSIDARSTKVECERALIESLQTKSLSERVIDYVRFYLDTNPSIKDLARQFNMTERTFRRKLEEEGTSFRTLVQGIREDMAKYYLGETKLQVSQIALKLGYAETSNFRSAFKSWTDMSPRDWRTWSRVSPDSV